MAWEWGHDNAATEYAREQLWKIHRTDLIEMAREWKYKINEVAEKAYDDEHWLDEDDVVAEPFEAPCKFDVDMASDEALKEFIWAGAESWEIGRLCTNGGYEIYLCPHGCHTVDLADMPEDWSTEEY